MQKYSPVSKIEHISPAGQQSSEGRLSTRTEKLTKPNRGQNSGIEDLDQMDANISRSVKAPADGKVLYHKRSTFTQENRHIIPLPINSRRDTTETSQSTLWPALSRAFLSITLFMINASQLRNCLPATPIHENSFHLYVILCLIISLLLQIIAAISLLLSYWSRSKIAEIPVNPENRRNETRCVVLARTLEHGYLILIFSVLIINVFIALFISKNVIIIDSDSLYSETVLSSSSHPIPSTYTTPQSTSTSRGINLIPATGETVTQWSAEMASEDV